MAAEVRETEPGVKLRTATLSVVSNSTLILLKVVAGTVTGSVAILTEAIHSSIDLIASFAESSSSAIVRASGPSSGTNAGS